MRNLKKILALVLALVMSLSLMATAGAAETTAAAADPYATAQTVLTGLKVFRGDTAGQMNWNQPITRVQTAALVYRINTGDVDDTKAGLHTSNPFADVATSYWGNSYISYGYNAGILKGMGGNNFAPDNQVTGYQTLAMILRAMGYGRNGEFEGTGWEVRTASTAQSLGLLKNVTPSDSTTLGQPASRGLVAEILLRALLTNKVMYSALNPYNYTELDEKLADNLGLEEQTGVVIANEWAALDDTKPLAADKTKVQVADGTYRTLDWGAESYAAGIEDIGQSRSIYIQNGSKVLLLADSGKNVVKFNNGEGKTRAAVADGLTTSTAEYYDNFDPAVVHYCDMRIEYNLRFVNNTAAELFFDKYCTASWADVKDTMDEDNSAAAAGYEYAYVKVIAADADISDTEMAIMKGIFTIADNTNRTLGIDGSVFVGTKSETGDYSDSASYKTFVEKELKERADPISSVGNGNELRIVDNNNDGAAEYVLRINYDLDTIVETKNDKFYYKGLDITKFTPAPIDGYTQTVGDVVLYAKIDGKAYVHKADTASATFKAIDYKNVIATDTEGKEWKQSAIGNYTALPDKLVEVDENTSYNMYLDDYGYVRAYDNKVSYALLTEVYPTQTQNTAWVVDRELTAEAMPVGEKAVKEYKVLNSYYNGTSNPFYTPYAWKYPGITTAWNNRYDTVWHGVANYLQPATHMLGVSGQERDKFWYEDTDRFVAWSEAAQRWVIKDEYADAFANSWNIGRDELNLNSWTNVAKYTQTSEGLNLYTAASHNGAKAVTDYIRLDRRNTDWNRINKTNPLFMIDDPYYNEIYTSAQTHYVRTVDSTVFYMVVVNESGVQGIRQYTGYSNLPTITDVNNVRSMYAVARNTAVNTDGNDYWVADVVVIEMYDYDVYESVSLIYSNNYKNQGDVKYLEALDSELGPIGIIPNNITVWNGQFTDYGFYGLNNVTVFDAEKKLYNADIVKITDNTASDDFGWYEGYGDGNNYNKHGIYYGQVRSIYAEDNLSDYVTIDVLDINGLVVDTVDVRVASYGGAYAINKKTNYNESIDLLLKSTTTNNQVKVGDKVMWVENDNTARTAGFLVDLTDVDVVDAITGLTKNRDWDTPSFLDVTEAGRLGRAQWVDGNNHYFGDPAAAYTYEEIIGKHNDRTAVKSVYAPQDGFVVSSYTLSINGVEIDPVFSGVMSDGLWHIRYNLNNNASDTVVISVERATDKDLVLNTPTTKLPANVRSTKYPNGVEVKGTGTNDIFGTANNYGAESWYFTMPALKVNEKIVGNIFADGTTIPSAYTTAGKFLYTYNETVIVPGTPGPVDPVDPDAEIKAELAAAKASAVTALETAAKTETDKLDPVADAAKIEAVNAALAAAVEAVNGVTLDEYKADKESVAKAQAAGEEAIAKAATAETPAVDTTEAMKILEDAYNAIENKTQAVEDAYTAAKAAVEAAAGAEDATAESVKAVAEAEAAKITAAAEEPDTPNDKAVVSLSYVVNGKAADGYNWSTEALAPTEGVISIPAADVEKLAALEGATITYAVKDADGNEIPNTEGSYIITVGETIPQTIALTVDVAVKAGGWEWTESGRMPSARLLAAGGEDVRWLKGTVILDTGMAPKEGTEFSLGTPGSFTIVWEKKELLRDDGVMAFWVLYATVSAADAETLNPAEIVVVVGSETNTETTAPEIVTKVVDSSEERTAEELPASAYELNASAPTKVVSGGKNLWSYEYLFKIVDSGSYKTAKPTVVFKDADKADGTPAPVVADSVDENGYWKITITGMAETVKAPLTLSVVAAKQTTIPVAVSDPVTTAADKTELVKGDAIEQVVTVTLKDEYADTFKMPATGNVAEITYNTGIWTVQRVDDKTMKFTFSKTIPADTASVTFNVVPVLKDAEASGVSVNLISDSSDLTSAITTGIKVGPLTITSGVDFNDVTLTLVPDSGKGLPAKASVSVGMKNAAGGVNWFTDGTGSTEKQFTYDEKTGVITFSNSETVTRDVYVCVTGSIPNAVESLTVTFDAKGKFTVKNEDGSDPDTAKLRYAVIKDGDTLYSTVEETVNSWVGAGKFTLSEIDNFNLYNFTAAGVLPALGVSDNGDADKRTDASYLVVVVDDGGVTHAGIAKVSGVTTPDAEEPVLSGDVVVSSDNGGNSQVTATRSNSADGATVTITLTAKEGYAFVAVTADNGDSVTPTLADEGETVFTGMYTYTVAKDGNSATIEIGGVVPVGAITVAVKSETLAATVEEYADLSVDVVTGAIQAEGTDLASDDKYIMLDITASDVDALKAKIAKVAGGKSVDEFLTALELTVGAAEDVKAYNAAIDTPVRAGGAKYILVMGVETSAVASAGIVENTFDGVLTISGESTLYGVEFETVDATKAKAALEDIEADAATIDIDDPAEGDVDLKILADTTSNKPGFASVSAVFFVTANVPGDLTDATWDDLVADEDAVVLGNNASVEGKVEAAGTLFVKVVSENNEENVMFYQFAISKT